MADASIEGGVPERTDKRPEAVTGETAVTAVPAAIPVHEAPEVEPDDEDEEPPVGHAPEDLGEDDRPVAFAAEADDEDTEAEDGQENVAGDSADEDGPLPPAPPATEAEETTLIPKVTEPRAGETTVLPPVSMPTPGMAHRPYTSAPVGYGGGRSAAASWGVPVIVIETAPEVGGALGSALSVRTVCVPSAGFGANEACIPAGRPLAVRPIFPVEPEMRSIARLSVVLVPWTSLMSVRAAAIVKLGWAGGDGVSNDRSSIAMSFRLSVGSRVVISNPAI